MNEQEKQLWMLHFLELGYDKALIEKVINDVEENRSKPESPPRNNAVITLARPDWEKGNTISIEEKKKRDKLLKAIEDTKRNIVRDLAIGMGTNDPKAQEAVASFNAQHVYNPTAAFEWGFPIATALGLGTGYMLGDLAGELYGETGRTLGGLVGGFIGGGINNPSQFMPKTKIVPTAALMWQLNRSKPRVNAPLLNVGWGPRLTMEVSHLSELPITQFRVYNPDLWGAAAEGLNPLGIWFSPRQAVGTPRMNPRKRLKAARARATFLTRPYEIQGDLTMDKPIVTIGDVPNRSALEYMAELSGADGVIFNNIYDNGLDATTSIKSFKEPEITKIVNRPRIEYYGPTMGKSTFVRENPNLPFDDADKIIFKDGLWNKRKELANNLGIDARDFGTNRVPAEIANSPLYKAAMLEYVASILDAMSAYVLNPANKGRTVLTSNKYILNPDNKIFLSNDPVVPDFNTFLTRNQSRGFKESPEEALEWWNNIASQDAVRVDNRYVSEILGPRVLYLKSKTPKIGQESTPLGQGVNGFKALYKFYGTLAYRQRVKEAYPYWSEKRVNDFILDKLEKTLLAMHVADYSHSGMELGAGGLTTISNRTNGQYPQAVRIAYDVTDPDVVAIHEGLHFSSRGGRNHIGVTDPNAAAIADYNEQILPEMTRSNYKEYLEAPNKEVFKEQYKKKVKLYFPNYTDEDLNEVYAIMLEEGAYYNHLDELRSFGLTDAINAWDHGEIKNLNNEEEIYEWLVEAWNHDKLDADFVRTLTDYRTDFNLWARFISKALSVVSIPTVQAFLNREKQNENNQ